MSQKPLVSSKAGIETNADGSSYIPASTRADGSVRKEIRVRPGYRPPEDVEVYKNRTAEAWKNRGSGSVPGVEQIINPQPTDSKSKNSKRREAARKKAAENNTKDLENVASVLDNVKLSNEADEQAIPNTNSDGIDDQEVERQKKIRNQLKKLKAVRELKAKKLAGEKLSPDQLMKVAKEAELLRDLKKLNYSGPEIEEHSETSTATLDTIRQETNG